MHRFYLPSAKSGDTLLTLPDKEAHHAFSVLRLEKGQPVTVLNGIGVEFRCRVQEANRRSILLSIEEEHFVPPGSSALTLIQAVTKGKTMDWTVQKATELGVQRIIPILTERTVAYVEAEDAEDKAAKWKATAIESIKQCGSAWLPRIDAPLPLTSFLARRESFALPMIATFREDAQHPRVYFETYFREKLQLPSTVSVWIGPEGDFTADEVSAAQMAGALPISLGKLVLRSETAAIYSIYVLSYELQAPRNGV